MSTSTPTSSNSTTLRDWLRSFRPAAMPVDARERLRVVIGAGLGMLLTGLLCHAFSMLAIAPSAVWLVAPMGASAVLVFGVPASPLAQPWAVVGGNGLSALVGIACMQIFGSTPASAALAVALAIGLMFWMRCLHPPGGAAALLMVMAGIHDWHFAFFPVLLNAIALTTAGVIYNSLTGRRYPHVQAPPPLAPKPAGIAAQPRFGEAELDAVIARYNQVLPVPRDDLQELLRDAETLTHEHTLGALRCADIMSPDVKTVSTDTPLQDAWALLRQHRIKALPVVDKEQHVIGVVTLADFLRDESLDLHEGFAKRLRVQLQQTRSKYAVVGDIMRRDVQVFRTDDHIADLVPVFASTGHHHIPVVGPNAQLAGILTQSDLVAALAAGYRR